MGLDCGLTLHATLAFWKMHWNLQAKGSFFYFWYMINGFHWEMFASIFTLHPNLSATFSSHHLYTHWCKRQSESAVERKLPSFWYAFCPDLSMFYICVTPCDYKCMGTWWQPRHFFCACHLTVIYLCPVQRRPSLPRVLRWPPALTRIVFFITAAQPYSKVRNTQWTFKG